MARFRTFVACFLVCLAARCGVAQLNTGTIAGSVRDPANAPLAGAQITAERPSTGAKYSVSVNTAGEYLMAQLPPGDYVLTAAAEGFKTAVISSVQVHPGDQLRRDFMLELGEHNDVVTVDAAAGPLELGSGTIRDGVQHEQVLALPLKGRQFLDLALLGEGVVRPPGGTRGDALQQAGTLVNILGQRSGHNLYLVDGVSVTDQHFNNMVLSPSIDSIQEVEIEKTSYAPEFGGKSGAVINVVTAAGSNTVHGSVFEFVRNDVFDAKNFFDAANGHIPPFRQNQFGATTSGPVIRNRTFFFLSYEGQQIRKALTQTFSVPTSAMRAGNFSGLPAIYDPVANNGAQRIPLPGNTIPVDRLDTVAQALLARIPLPNLPGIAQNLRATETQRMAGNTYSARLDHQFTTSNTVFLRGSVFDASEFDPFGSGVLQETLLPGFGRGLRTHTINGVAGWTHVFNPSLLNEFRFGFLSVAGGQTSPNAGNDFAATAGLAGVATTPVDMGYPQVSFGGQFSTMGDPGLFTYRDNRDIELYDNVIRHAGAHTLKSGAYLFHFNFQPVNPNGARGIFSFTPRWTASVPGAPDGNAFADFVLGYPTTAQAGLGRGAMRATTTWAHLYAQDDWQITPRLKLDFGIRYEYNRNMTDMGNRMAAVDMSVPGGRFVIASPSVDPYISLIPIPYVAASSIGWNNSLLVPRNLRFAPRAGFAWNLPSRSRTIIRAGYGIYPNQAAYSIVSNFAQNLPFFVTKTVNTSATALTPVYAMSEILNAPALGTVGANNLNHDYQVEYNEVWNFNLKRELPAGMTFSAAYIGSHTVHADSATLLNVPAPGPGAVAARRDIPQMSQFNTIRWDGWATYNALTLRLSRKLTTGLMFDANWTWSHSIDDASDPGATLNENNVPQDVNNRGAEKASSSFDHRQRGVIQFMYALPFSGRSAAWMRVITADWQVSGDFTRQSGAPFTVNVSTDQANIGAGPAQRPNLAGNPNRGPKRPEQWFETTVFSLPALYTFGDAPRNALIGPGLAEFDVSLQKSLTVKERARLLFRAEAYNIANHPNFNIPNRIAFTPNFGKISSAQDSRQMQLALKIVF